MDVMPMASFDGLRFRHWQVEPRADGVLLRVAQPAIINAVLQVMAARLQRNHAMIILFLEALGALLIFLFIIWWTMFSGRKNGELPSATPSPQDQSPAQSEPAKPD